MNQMNANETPTFKSNAFTVHAHGMSPRDLKLARIASDPYSPEIRHIHPRILDGRVEFAARLRELRIKAKPSLLTKILTHDQTA